MTSETAKVKPTESPLCAAAGGVCLIPPQPHAQIWNGLEDLYADLLCVIIYIMSCSRIHLICFEHSHCAYGESFILLTQQSWFSLLLGPGKIWVKWSDGQRNSVLAESNNPFDIDRGLLWNPKFPTAICWIYIATETSICTSAAEKINDPFSLIYAYTHLCVYEAAMCLVCL